MTTTSPPTPPTPLAARAVRRGLARRESTAVEEVQRLLDAGLQVIEGGDTETAPKVADIVATAGLSNQAFYRHFAGRDELVAAVVEAGALRLVSYLAHQMDKIDPDDPDRRIRIWVEGVLSQAGKPDVAKATRAVLWNMRQLPRPAGEGGRLSALGELLLEPLRAAGSPDPERDAAVLVDVVFGRLDHHLWVSPPSEDDVDHLVGFCLRAIAR
jgi:AcrR family transcriptional regulator